MNHFVPVTISRLFFVPQMAIQVLVNFFQQ